MYVVCVSIENISLSGEPSRSIERNPRYSKKTSMTYKGFDHVTKGFVVGDKSTMRSSKQWSWEEIGGGSGEALGILP